MPFLSQALNTQSNSGPKAGANDVSNKVSGLVSRMKNKIMGKDATGPDLTKSDPSNGGDADPSDYHKGGKVKKTGKAKVEKGERVLTRKQAKKYSARKRA